RIAADRGGWPAVTAPSDERDPRPRPPTRVAGSRPSATQRCTVRTVTPSSSATWRGVSASSVMSRLSQSRRRLLRPPGRCSLLQKRGQALLPLRRDALPGGPPHGGGARLVVIHVPLFADERLGGARGARTGRSDVRP